MSELFARLQGDLNSARKSQDKAGILLLGTVLSEVKNKKIELKRDPTDADVIDVLRKSIKRRRESVEMYKSLMPDVVTMDITMPEMDGISAVREIKKVDANAKVIMCTAMGQKNMVMEAVQAGAKDFIIKPFQPEKVLESVQKLIG